MTLRKQVLQSFKSLHKARKTIFKGDTFTLEQARLKINEEYKKNKNLGHDKTEQLLIFANEVENELKKTVIQAVEMKPGSFEACITSDTLKLDNVPFREVCEGKLT